MKKFGFTLAEILTVLVIIGILTAILLPIAFQSSPDENVMKFKKGYNTLGTVIRELVSSDKYYQDGDLGIKAGGEIVDSSTYFCETFADIVSTKSVECSQDSDANYNDVQFVQFGKGEKGDEHGTIEEAKEALDSACKSYAQKIGAEIVTFDGISYYQTAPSIHFGVAWRASLEQNASPEGEEENNANKTLNERAESELNA